MARILVAEDDDGVRQFVARTLRLNGHEVIEAEDGGLAAETMQAEAGRFDLLLSDIKMPVMDGIALALTVAAQFPAVTIVLMTGFADQRERAHGLDALIYDIIAKPFSLADLTQKVEDALARKPVAVVSMARTQWPGLTPVQAGTRKWLSLAKDSGRRPRRRSTGAGAAGERSCAERRAPGLGSSAGRAGKRCRGSCKGGSRGERASTALPSCRRGYLEVEADAVVGEIDFAVGGSHNDAVVDQRGDVGMHPFEVAADAPRYLAHAQRASSRHGLEDIHPAGGKNLV
jgi:two-component system, cell cycle response regulator CpdR